MIIKKLNATFRKHSRWLFALFTIVIIISFVGFLAPGQFGFGGMTGDSYVVGTAFGKDVTVGELREYIQGGQREVNIEQLFMRHCYVTKAKQMGFAVSDKEVATELRKLFNEDGKFSMDKYNAFLKANRLSENEFNQAIRQDLLIAKMFRSVSDGIVVTEGEARDLYRQQMVRFEAKAAVFEAKAFRGQVKPNSAAVKEFFEKNRDRYVIPGTFDVLLVEFPYQLFTAQAGTLVTAEDVKKYYESGKSGLVDKDGKPLAFDAAKKQIREKLTEQKARVLARNSANKFASGIYEKLNDFEPAEREAFFRNSADAAKLIVIEEKGVECNSGNIGKIKSPQMVAMLGREKALNLSEEIVGDNAVYYGFICKTTAPRSAELKEVAIRVKNDLTEAKSMELVQAAAENARKEVMAVTDITKREAAFSALKECKIQPFDFSLLDTAKLTGLYPAAFSVLELAPGEVGQPVPEDGAVQLAMLLKRLPADMSEFDKKRDEIVSMYQRYKAEQAQQIFAREILSQCSWNGGQEK